jgi:hypothetical protein
VLVPTMTNVGGDGAPRIRHPISGIPGERGIEEGALFRTGLALSWGDMAASFGAVSPRGRARCNLPLGVDAR